VTIADCALAQAAPSGYIGASAFGARAGDQNFERFGVLGA
jgi:hypothetical protein